MSAQLADLRLYALMSLALMSCAFCQRPYVGFRPFQYDWGPNNQNNFFDDSLNDIVDLGIVAPNSQMFSVNGLYMSAELSKVMMSEAERNFSLV